MFYPGSIQDPFHEVDPDPPKWSGSTTLFNYTNLKEDGEGLDDLAREAESIKLEDGDGVKLLIIPPDIQESSRLA